MIYRMMVHNVSDPKSERLKSLKCPVCVSCGRPCVLVRRAQCGLVKRCSSSLSLVAESELSAVGPQPGCAALAGPAGGVRGSRAPPTTAERCEIQSYRPGASVT